MTAESALLGSDDIRLLTEIGFLAAGRGELARAEAIFGALALLRPERAFAHVGIALALINRGRPGEAAARTERVHLPAGPERELLAAVRALALQLDRRNAEATRLLQSVVRPHANAREPASDGVRLARRLLGEDVSAAPAALAAAPV
ncbi:hypothetical protein [Comamonas sp. NLF-1-9]|uniref:hypothetical protein n=1 Tax=Comamonas sp. NLF-1-9 TaxID=2853163 RepID=UPI002103B596|nr:hypothetical protein [Comamonas sp. NLF-1-9]